MSSGEKEIDEVYAQCDEAWELALAFAALGGYEVGVREPTKVDVDDTDIDKAYRTRGEAWMAAMTFAKLAGYEVGVREPGEWPVHVIYLPGIGEVALHIRQDEAIAEVLEITTDRKYDGHTNADRSERTRAFVKEVAEREVATRTDLDNTISGAIAGVIKVATYRTVDDDKTSKCIRAFVAVMFATFAV